MADFGRLCLRPGIPSVDPPFTQRLPFRASGRVSTCSLSASRKTSAPSPASPLDEGGLTGSIILRTKFRDGDFRHFYLKGDRKRQVAKLVAALRRDAGQNRAPFLLSRIPPC
jgi:hypothetical protein